MEVRQLKEFNFAPIVNKQFAVKWSSDDRISVITEKDVQIFKLKYSLNQNNTYIKVSRSSIKCPNTIPCMALKDELNSVLYDWKRQEIYEMLMEEAISPVFPDAAPASMHITEVLWSPQNMYYPDRCILALITSVGEIGFFCEFDNDEWSCIYKFNEHWSPLIIEELQRSKKKQKEPNNCAFFQKHLRQLQATCAAWSEIWGSGAKSFAYFASAYRSSEIAVWKIFNLKSSSQTLSVNLKLRQYCEGESKITSLLWVNLDGFRYILLIGKYSGEIEAFNLILNGGELQFESLTKYYSEADLISVNSMKILNQNKNGIIIAVMKSMFLLNLELDNNGKLINIKSLQSPGFSITGLSKSSNKNLLMITEDGSLNHINYADEVMTCKYLPNDIIKKNLHYLGLSNSSNNLIYLLIGSPNTMYDHLVLREPSNALFFSLNDKAIDLYDSLISNNNLICSSWDYFELMKMNACQYQKESISVPHNMEQIENLSMHELKCLYWVLVINTFNFTKDDILRIRNTEQMNIVKNLIFLCSACNFIEKLLPEGNLSTEQKHTISLLSQWLKMWSSGKKNTPLLNQVNEIIEKSLAIKFNKQEKCELCNSSITNLTLTECPTGHKLLRCSQTLLQINTIKFRSCPICFVMFHPSLDHASKIIRCIYCDTPAVYDNRLSD